MKRSLAFFLLTILIVAISSLPTIYADNLSITYHVTPEDLAAGTFIGLPAEADSLNITIDWSRYSDDLIANYTDITCEIGILFGDNDTEAIDAIDIEFLFESASFDVASTDPTAATITDDAAYSTSNSTWIHAEFYDFDHPNATVTGIDDYTSWDSQDSGNIEPNWFGFTIALEKDGSLLALNDGETVDYFDVTVNVEGETGVVLNYLLVALIGSLLPLIIVLMVISKFVDFE